MTTQASVYIQPRSITDERNFYLSMGIVCALIVFVGFSPTYFLRPFFELPASISPLSPVLHLHTAIFAIWIALFITQTALIRSDRRDLHRRLGVLGLIMAVAIVTINFATVSSAIAAAPTVGPPTARLYIALTSSAIAAGFITAGVYFRKNRDLHKRLMLLSTISMVGPSLNRIIIRYGLDATFRYTIAALICVCMLNDLIRRRRVHPVYVVGLAILIGSQVSRGIIPQTAAWQSFARWVLG